MNFQKYLYLFFLILFTSFSYANELRILTNEEPPTNYLDEDKRIVGITVDVVEKLKEQLNIKSDIELLTWDLAYKIAKNEPNIMLFTAGKTFERIKEGFHFIGPVTTKKHILYSNNSSKIDMSTALDIKNKKLRIGAMRGDWRAKYFKDKGLIVQEVSNHQDNIEKLILGKIDLWASSNLEMPLIAKKAKISEEDIEGSYVFKEFASYLMLSKKTSKKDVKKWQIAYKQLQRTDFFDKTAKKWSNILHIDLKYSKDKGFYKQ